MVKLRGTRTRAEVCRRVEDYGLTLDKSTLFQYEAGTVAAPDPAVLWALARIYHIDSADELLTVLAMERAGRTTRVDIDTPALAPDQLHFAELVGALLPTVRAPLLRLLTEILRAQPPATMTPAQMRQVLSVKRK